MQSVNTPLLIFSLIVIYTTKLVITKSIGDSCVDVYKLNGTVKYIIECPNVLNQKFNNRRYSTLGFEDGKEKVCCGERTRIPPAKKTESARKYIRACEEYKSKLFDRTISFTSLTAGAAATKKTASNCTQYTFPLVVGGVDANPKEFAHMALLGCKDDDGNSKWICGGTLISTNYVLTAAHCIEDASCDEITVVRLGELDLSSSDDDAQPKDFDVASIIVHPQYNDTLNKYNDIGLIKLATNVEFNQYIRPACLPYEDYGDESQLIITGWGSTISAGPKATHLQKAGVSKFEQEECNNVYAEEELEKLPIGVRNRVQICAGPKHKETDTCQGDSGGPLQIVHPNHPCMFSVVGVTSLGQGCGTIGIPGIYTRVFHYIQWIEDIVWEY